MLLNTNKAESSMNLFRERDQQRKSKPAHIKDVKVGEIMPIISTNAGLWAYNIGDTVKFFRTDPYRIVVSGRTKHLYLHLENT